MTRKHFKALAEAIATITNNKERSEVARLIANVCTTTNWGFNRSEFYKVCNAIPNQQDAASTAHHGLTGE